MSRTDSQFKLRMPADLRAQVEAAAKKANRSLNAEIVTRLQGGSGQVSESVSATCLSSFLFVIVSYLWQVRSGRDAGASEAAHKSLNSYLSAGFLLGAITAGQWRRLCNLSDNALLVAEWDRGQQ